MGPKRKARKRADRKAPSAKRTVAADDPMSQCVALCQEERWREALLLCRRMSAKAESEGLADLYGSLTGAQQKIEYSLRRQMAVAAVTETSKLLRREYLLDVG